MAGGATVDSREAIGWRSEPRVAHSSHRYAPDFLWTRPLPTTMASTLFDFFRRVHDHFAGFAGRTRQGLASAAQRAERRSHHAQSADDRR